MTATLQIIAGTLALFLAAPYTRAETVSNPATHHERIIAAGAGTGLDGGRDIIVVENPALPPSSSLGSEENPKLRSAPGSTATGVGNAPNDSLCMLDPPPSSVVTEVDQFANALSRRAPLPKERIEEWLRGCSFDEAKSKLTKAGFEVGEYDKLSKAAIDSGISRLAVAERAVRTYSGTDSTSPSSNEPIMALIARITLRQFAAKGLDMDGYIYIDGP